MKKLLVTLNINDYDKEITGLTFPYMKEYAQNIGADFHVIKERKFPDFPLMLEEFQMERKLDNAAYSFGTFSLNGILSSNNKLINYTTRKGLSLIENNKYLKRLFVKSATGEDFFKSF